jgi:hypothetical protein
MLHEATLFQKENMSFSNKKKGSVLKGILKKNCDPERRRTTHHERVQKLKVKFFPSSPLTVTSPGKKSVIASPEVAPASATATPTGTPVDPPLSRSKLGRSGAPKVVAQSATAVNARAPPGIIAPSKKGGVSLSPQLL